MQTILRAGASGPLQLRGEGGPLSRCELGAGGGGVWETDPRGRALSVLRCQKKTGGEPDLPSLCVKSRVNGDFRRPAVLLWWARPLERN